MLRVGLLLFSIALVHANPIVVEPVNPVAVANGIVKAMESSSPAIPLANSVQSVVREPVVPKVQPIEDIIKPVVPSNYAPEQIVPVAPVAPVAPVVPVVAPGVAPVVPVAPVEPVAVVPSVPVAAAAAPVPVDVPVEPAAPVVPVVPVVPESPVVPYSAAAVAPVAPEIAVDAKVIPSAPVDPIADKNSVDPSALLTEPIDQATKLVIDLDEHLKKYLAAEDEVATTLAPHIYAGDVAESEAERQNNQMTALIDQVNQLAGSIENTITDLVARRRYVTAAMLRSMLNYVRRVRVNLERLQNRLQSVQAVATSGQSSPGSAGSASAVPGGAFLNTIRDRINRMTEEIGALVTRIRGSFTPGSAVVTSPLPPLVTAANLESIGAAAASGSILSAVNTVNSVPQNAAVAAVVTQ